MLESRQFGSTSKKLTQQNLLLKHTQSAVSDQCLSIRLMHGVSIKQNDKFTQVYLIYEVIFQIKFISDSLCRMEQKISASFSPKEKNYWTAISTNSSLLTI